MTADAGSQEVEAGELPYRKSTDLVISGGSTELIGLGADGHPLPATNHTKVPAIITDAGEDAITRFAEFFTVNIRNPHTRRAYYRNALAFLRWCERKQRP